MVPSCGVHESVTLPRAALASDSTAATKRALEAWLAAAACEPVQPDNSLTCCEAVPMEQDGTDGAAAAATTTATTDAAKAAPAAVLRSTATPPLTFSVLLKADGAAVCEHAAEICAPLSGQGQCCLTLTYVLKSVALLVLCWALTTPTQLIHRSAPFQLHDCCGCC
jgi:hypothetical protein